MKTIFSTLLFLSISLFSYAQKDYINELKSKYNFEIVNDGVVFSRNYSTDSISKDAMYSRIEESLYSFYKNPNECIQLKSKDTYTFITKFYVVPLAEFPNVIVSPYTMKILVKDNSYQVRIKISKYGKSFGDKFELIGFVLKNHPFEEINSSNNMMRVPDKCFEGLCNVVDFTFNQLNKSISENDF